MSLNHIFGNITEQLADLTPPKLYKYKVVASYNGGKFKQIFLCKTEKEAILTIEANRSKYGQGWVVTYYNIED